MEALQTAFYGKIKARGDFVRAGGGENLGFGAWLEQALAALHKQGLAPADAFFLFRRAGADQVLLGATAPTADAVGRVFPSAVFMTLDAGWATHAAFALPTQAFLFSALALARRAAAPDVDVGALEVGLQTLPTLTMIDAPAAPLLAASPEARCYAFHTLAVACAQARDDAARDNATRGDAASGIMLDCPLAETREAGYWLELTTRLLAPAQRPPAFLMTPARLIVALSEPPPVMLALIAKPGSQHPKLWPLTSTNPRALDAAAAALNDAQRALVAEPDVSPRQMAQGLW